MFRQAGQEAWTYCRPLYWEDLDYLEQQVVLEDALDWLQQVGAQGQRVLQQLLPVPEEFGLLLVLHAFRQGGHRAGVGRRGCHHPWKAWEGAGGALWTHQMALPPLSSPNTHLG